MNARIIHRVSLLLVLALALAACRGSKPKEAATQPPTKEQATEAEKAVQGVSATEAEAGGTPEIGPIQVGYLPIGAFSPFFLAIEKGYFAEQGLEVEMTPFRTGGEMIAPLSLGQLDVGGGEFGTALLNAISQEHAVKTVLSLSGVTEGHGYITFVVRKDLFDSGEVTQIADLKGKKVAVNAVRGMTEYDIAEIMAQAGMTVDDVELTIIPFPDMVQALANGAVDAALLQYPLANTALKPGENGEPPIAEVLLPGEDITPNGQNAVIYYGKRLLDPKNHEVGVRFAMAMLKAARDLQGDEWRQDDEIVNILVKWTKSPEAAVRNTIIPFYNPNGGINRTSTEDIQNYLVGRGYTEYKDPLSMDKVIDDSFAQDAVSRLGEYKAEQEAGAVSVPLPDIGPLQVGYLPIGAFSPFFLAVEKGYFAEQGLEVELTPFRTGGEMIAPLSLGQLDVGGGETGTALLNAVSKNLDVRTVYSLSMVREGHGYITFVIRNDLAESGEVKGPADLKGRKIAVNATHGLTEYDIAEVARRGGFSIDDVELVTIPFPDMVQALSNGAVDAALLQYPLAATALRPGENGEPPIASVLIPGEEIHEDAQKAVVYIGKRLLEPENREVAVRFLMALLKAAREMYGDDWRQDGEIVGIIAEYTKVPEDVVSKTIFPYYEPNGQFNKASLEDIQKYLVGRGYTEYQELVPLASIIDESYLEEALSRLGEYEGD